MYIYSISTLCIPCVFSIHAGPPRHFIKIIWMPTLEELYVELSSLYQLTGRTKGVEYCRCVVSESQYDPENGGHVHLSGLKGSVIVGSLCWGGARALT